MASVKALVAVVQIAVPDVVNPVLPVTAVAFAAGLTVTETMLEVETHAPLVATALYHVVGVAAA